MYSQCVDCIEQRGTAVALLSFDAVTTTTTTTTAAVALAYEPRYQKPRGNGSQDLKGFNNNILETPIVSNDCLAMHSDAERSESNKATNAISGITKVYVPKGTEEVLDTVASAVMKLPVG
jgi:hypothetical protein